MQNNTTTRRFHVSDILSVSTGRLVSDRNMDGVYDLEGFLTGDDLSTIGIATVAKDCRKFLFETFPELRDVSTDRLDQLLDASNGTRTAAEEACRIWVQEIIVQLGKEFFDVPAMPTPQP